MNPSPLDLNAKPVWQVCVFRKNTEGQNHWLAITALMIRADADKHLKKLLSEKPDRILGVRLKKEILMDLSEENANG